MKRTLPIKIAGVLVITVIMIFSLIFMGEFIRIKVNDYDTFIGNSNVIPAIIFNLSIAILCLVGIIFLIKNIFKNYKKIKPY